jgi:hypothetical protein
VCQWLEQGRKVHIEPDRVCSSQLELIWGLAHISLHAPRYGRLTSQPAPSSSTIGRDVGAGAVAGSSDGAGGRERSVAVQRAGAGASAVRSQVSGALAAGRRHAQVPPDGGGCRASYGVRGRAERASAPRAGTSWTSSLHMPTCRRRPPPAARSIESPRGLAHSMDAAHVGCPLIAWPPRGLPSCRCSST